MVCQPLKPPFEWVGVNNRNEIDSAYFVIPKLSNTIDTLNLYIQVGSFTAFGDCQPQLTIYVQP